MISKELNIGRAGQYLTLVDLLSKGIQAFDTAEGVSFDVVAEHNGKLIRLQVKATQKMRVIREGANPIYFFHIKRAGKNGARFYDKNDFDAFALVALDRREVYYLKFDENIKANSICIRDKKVEYKAQAMGGTKNGLYLQDLTWENLCKKL
ncbi:MAG: group I intron-associated PD-(D/E)XK endonuclease [Magnetococcus sp. WYHC-3]